MCWRPQPQVINEMAVQTMILNQDRLTKNFYVFQDPRTLEWSRFAWDLEDTFTINSVLGGAPPTDYCILECEQWNSPLFGDSNHPQVRVLLLNCLHQRATQAARCMQDGLPLAQDNWKHTVARHCGNGEGHKLEAQAVLAAGSGQHPTMDAHHLAERLLCGWQEAAGQLPRLPPRPCPVAGRRQPALQP